MTSATRVSATPMANELDLLLTVVGYESRSLHVAEKLSAHSGAKVAFSFGSDGVLLFDRNLQRSVELGFEIRAIDEGFSTVVSTLLRHHYEQGARAVGIDISSMTKLHIAEVVDVLIELNADGLAVDFLYAPADSAGWAATDAPIQVAEPIHPAFSSWVDDPALPLVAIIGLGVEENLALGVAEQLDVAGVYAFSPRGSDPVFDRMGSEANREFFVANYLVRSSSYDLLSPFDLFARLESLIYGIGDDCRIAIVPLGPKIFALAGLLATVASRRSATVWRFSHGISDEPADVKPAGPVVSLRVELQGNSA